MKSSEYLIFNSTDDDTVNVKLKVSNGFCADSINHDVIIRAHTLLFTPNAFTPNEDGVNDVFYPNGVHYADTGYELLIFDRWGEIIYKTNDAAVGWNGKRDNNKQDAQVDVYVWMLVHVNHFTRQKQDPIVGRVVLLR